MRLVLCLALLVINAETVTVKPRSVNLALETVLKFNNHDNSADLRFIDNVQTFLSKVRNAIGGKKIDRRYFNGGTLTFKFSDFIETLLTILGNFDDEDLEDVSAVISNELHKYHYENCKFYELLDNKDMRRFVGQKLDRIKYVTAETMRKQLKDVLNLLRVGKLDDNVQEFIDYINSLYTASSELKLNKFVDNLKLYSSKSKRANLDLIKIVREGIRSIIFDHYTSLNVNARRDFKLRLETFWKQYIMHPNNAEHNVKFNLKLHKNTRASSEKNLNAHDSYLKKLVNVLPGSGKKISSRKGTKRTHDNDVTPMKVHKSYEFVKKTKFDGNRLTFENFDDISRSIDDTSKLQTNKNNPKDKQYKKSSKAYDNIVLDDIDKTVTQKLKTLEGRNDNQDIFDIDNEAFIKKTPKSKKPALKHSLKKPKLLKTNKRKSTKSKHYNKKRNHFDTKQDYTMKTKHSKSKHSKHVKENKKEISEYDNISDNTTVTKTQVTTRNKKIDEFNETKKAIFLTLYPEDFTVKFTRKRSNNKITRKNHKKNTIWEDLIAMKKTTKNFDPEEDNLEYKKIRHQEPDNYVNIMEATEPMQTLDNKSTILMISKSKKVKQYHKLRRLKNHKKNSIYFEKSKKFRKSRGSSVEGISIESFEKNQRHLIYRKMNNQKNASSSNINTKDIEKQIMLKNVSKITTESNPMLNEINDYGTLDFWEGTIKTTKKFTSAAKSSTTATEPTTSTTTYREKTIFVTNSSKIKNITDNIYEANKATKSFEIVLRSNNKNKRNITMKTMIINQTDTPELPFADVKNTEKNVTTVKNKLTTTESGKPKQKLTNRTSKPKHNIRVSNTKNETKSVTLSLIRTSTEIETNNTGLTSTSTTIKTSPKFHLGNFLNQSKVDFGDDKKKLVHENILKDMEVIFAPTTQTTVTIPKEATDPFRDIEEALDFV